MFRLTRKSRYFVQVYKTKYLKQYYNIYEDSVARQLVDKWDRQIVGIHERNGRVETDKRKKNPQVKFSRKNNAERSESIK